MLLMLGSVGYSQNSGNSTNRAELISLSERAVEEVKESRKMIAALDDQVAGLESLTAKAENLQMLSTEEIKLRKAEAATLRAALDKEREALVLKQKESDRLRKDLASAVKKKNFFKKVAIGAVVVAVTLIVVK